MSSGMMATLSGFLFLLVWLFGPQGVRQKQSRELVAPPTP
jgi:hypothetical protein